jgi:hypothetical protein
MSFIKRGGIDGKIINIIDGDDLTEEQKKSVKKISKELIKQDELVNSSKQEKLGN